MHIIKTTYRLEVIPICKSRGDGEDGWAYSGRIIEYKQCTASLLKYNTEDSRFYVDQLDMHCGYGIWVLVDDLWLSSRIEYNAKLKNKANDGWYLWGFPSVQLQSMVVKRSFDNESGVLLQRMPA